MTSDAMRRRSARIRARSRSIVFARSGRVLRAGGRSAATSSRTTSTSVTASSVAERGQAVEERELAEHRRRVDRLERALVARQPHADGAFGQQVERAVLLAGLHERESGADLANLGVREDRRPVRGRGLGHEQQVGRVLVGLFGKHVERTLVHAAQRKGHAEKAGQAADFCVDRLRSTAQPSNGSSASPSGPPRPGDRAVDEERPDRLRHLRVEDRRAVLLGQDQRAAGVGEQRGVPGAEEAHRRGRVGVRQRQVGEVEQLGAVLGLEAAQRQPLERRLDVARGQPAPVGDLGLRGRPEARQVAGDEVVERVVRRDVGRPDPVLGEPVEVRAAALPGARRRARGPCRPTSRSRANRSCRAARRSPCASSGPSASAVAQRPRLPPRRASCFVARRHHARRGVAGRDRQRPVVGARDEVDRDPHQRRLDDLAVARARGSARRARSPRPATTARCTSTARTAPAARPSRRARPGSRARGARAGPGGRAGRG